MSAHDCWLIMTISDEAWVGALTLLLCEEPGTPEKLLRACRPLPLSSAVGVPCGDVGSDLREYLLGF